MLKEVVGLLTERQLLILETIIRDYTDLGQPIGSKTLQEQLPIRVSSATIRNEMAVLEKQGFITKEHSSSGRIPSLKGYRYYVDNLVKPVKIDSKSVRSIQSLFGNEYRRVDEIIEMSAKILSDLTNYTAITLRPEASDLKLEGFRMVPLGNGQVMVILVASDGSVESQIYNLPNNIDGDSLEAVIRLINDKLVDSSLSEVTSKLQELQPLLTKYIEKSDGFIDVFGGILDKAIKEQFYIGGRRNLLNFANGNNLEQIKSLYSLIDDESDKIGGLVDNTTNPHDHHGISVKIGDEMSDRLLLDYSLVSATYNVGSHGRGMIAILGPTNMPYSKMIGLVEVFQKELTKKLIDYYRNFDE